MDNEDWITTSNLIDVRERGWCKITIDRFASEKYRKSREI